ncbi:MAG TPA: glycosyltransferase [Anaerolineaceae bacterium]|nr:glycosyltransferase [Anaerolineaceae bacterium]HPN52297.1 glycosyltransferase [Anaerolineaceae bacterium]
MTDAPPAFSLIMPCYNRAYDLLRVLRAYDEQDASEPFELIAIDDGSQDETFSVLTNYQPQRYILRALRQEKNAGPAAARNRGMDLAAAPLVAFVGDDIMPASGFVRAHLQAHRRRPDPHIAILGYTCWPPDMPQNTLMVHIDGAGAEQFSYHYMQNGQTYDYRHLYTSNISLKRDFLRSVGRGFDTGFPYAAFEDVELGYRLARRGLKIIYDTSPVAYHYHYHTIFTFSRRQYVAGLSSCILVRKQPGVLGIIGGQYSLMMRNLLRGLIRPVGSPELTAWLEEKALELCSFVEWSPNPLLDRLYVTILSYYYHKGVIDGTFGAGSFWATRANQSNAMRYLALNIGWYVQEADLEGIPLPASKESYLEKLR